ncbi:hypothetical protein PMIN06_012222 [Paraphaeosphaeria minitans]|uniref:Uncharacterized protein n=1 Tax=Paraphaeosphaeria minitans TaxID=565426 RepID=A0A9P6KNX3_9PLEO|nr:hypothetical protein PMIN01_09160 [Paraphaeosphaeria minitans]
MPFLAGLETVALLGGLALSSGIAVPWITTVETRVWREENAALCVQGRPEVSYGKFLWWKVWRGEKLSPGAGRKREGETEGETESGRGKVRSEGRQMRLGRDGEGMLVVVERGRA